MVTIINKTAKCLHGNQNECDLALEYLYKTLQEMNDLRVGIPVNRFCFGRITNGDIVIVSSIVTPVNTQGEVGIFVINEFGFVRAHLTTNSVVDSNKQNMLYCARAQSYALELYEYCVTVENKFKLYKEYLNTVNYVNAISDIRSEYYNLFERIIMWVNYYFKLKRSKNFIKKFERGNYYNSSVNHLYYYLDK